MKRNVGWSAFTFVVAGCFLGVSGAKAAPITGNIMVGTNLVATYVLVDDLTSTNLSINGLPVAVTDATTLNIGTNWRYQLTLSFRDNPNPDFVAISGTVQHINPPPDAPSHNAADSFMVSLTYTAGVQNELVQRRGATHNPHLDSFSEVIAGIDVGQEIQSWNAVITGAHIPEPSTVWLLGCAAALLAGGQIRRRMNTRSIRFAKGESTQGSSRRVSRHLQLLR